MHAKSIKLSSAAVALALSCGMLVTHWLVESTSRAQALRASALDMIDNAQFKAPGAKQPAFVYAHPIFWAPFVLVGDGGV